MSAVRPGTRSLGLVAPAILALALTVLAFAPAAAAAGPDVAGTWVSIDTDDGSTQALAIGRGPMPATTYLDFYASSCAGAGSPSTQFVATGRAAIEGTSVRVDFRNGGCGWRKIGPFTLEFIHDPVGDTLTDGFGITWHRYP